MKTGPGKTIVLLACAALYWHFVCWLTGAREPWDADAYWKLWYPASLGLSAVAGLVFRQQRWAAGGIITFAQFPVIWTNTGTHPLLAIGLLMLCLLAVPAIAVSALSGWFADRSW